MQERDQLDLKLRKAEAECSSKARQEGGGFIHACRAKTGLLRSL